MLTLQITKDQVFTLIEQLSLNDQQEVLQYLVEKTREDLDDTPDDIVDVVLVTIYSKSDTSDIENNVIEKIIKEFVEE
jgi:hypothetical protein